MPSDWCCAWTAHPGKPWLFLFQCFYLCRHASYLCFSNLYSDRWLHRMGRISWEFWESLCGFMAGFCVCVSMRGDNVFSCDWEMRWSLAPRGAPLFAFPLFHHRLPPFLEPPQPACSYLSAVKDFDRKGNPTLGIGQRWRREQEPSGACVHAALQSERPSTGCAISSLSGMLAGGLASVTDGNISNIFTLHQQKKKSLPPHGGGHQKCHFVYGAMQLKN